MSAAIKEQQDLDAKYWSIEQAALHFGVRRATIRQYIRDGLPTYFGGVFVKPKEAIAEWLKRKNAKAATRDKAVTRGILRNDDSPV